MLDRLERIVKNYQGNSQVFLRTLLKEAIQDYILYFVYNSAKYKSLVFTGGTCLRKLYNLPRLSEDLDFDGAGNIAINDLGIDVLKYFSEGLQYKSVDFKISGNGQSLMVRFPKLLGDLGLIKNHKVESAMLFVRIDLAEKEILNEEVSVGSVTTLDEVFFVRSYNLETLFANKIEAFLSRYYFKGSDQAEPFKGRDVYDLLWFFERVEKSNFVWQPNWTRVFREMAGFDKIQIVQKIVDKLNRIDSKGIESDLSAFLEQKNIGEDYGNNVKSVLVARLERFLQVLS